MIEIRKWEKRYGVPERRQPLWRRPLADNDVEIAVPSHEPQANKLRAPTGVGAAYLPWVLATATSLDNLPGWEGSDSPEPT
ncbi:MAG TPA: hypothetical protein VGM83_14580 [Devosiaceae bacterium]|jgi:hypothetical protein